MLKTIRFRQDAPDRLFVRYIAEFWTPDSPYVRECSQVKKKPLSAGYIKLHHDDVERHIEPFPGFRGVSLQSLTAGVIRDWMTWAVGRGLSGRRVNMVLQSMRVAVRYAVSREGIDRGPFKNIGEAAALVRAPAKDPRTRLAVLLGLLCGLRRGEIRSLQWVDIGEGLITVCHNWIDGEGLKAPKCKKAGRYGKIDGWSLSRRQLPWSWKRSGIYRGSRRRVVLSLKERAGRENLWGIIFSAGL
ncbi:MAG: hypothetical protein LBO65_02520 [Spirochaetaceae bacterium]|nr:hypothetical protein [Spirochaetaceae bacterium]